MATITSSGIGSGLDIAGLVQQLIAAEGQPAEVRIAQQEARLQGKLSAFGSLKSSLSAFNDQLQKMSTLDTFLVRKASSADEDLVTVVVDETAVPASYGVEVTQLAQAQKLQSGAFTSSTAVVGTGTLSIAVGTDSFNITIDSTNNTLQDIRDAINNASDNKGVAATIVNSDTNSYLILTGENTGSAQSMIITQSGGDGGLSALEYDPPNSLNSLTQTAAAHDSTIKVDGFDVTSATNTVTSAIDGVTLDLVAANVGVTTQITVDNDLDTVRQQINAFVDSYNELIDTFDSLTSFDVDSEVAAPLLGDSAIRNVRDQLRRQLSVAVTDIQATFNTLTEIGIETDIDGKLTVDGTKLDSFLTTEFTKVGQLFANSDGFAVRLSNVVDSYLDEDDGIIASRIDGLGTTVDDFAVQREALNKRLAALEVRLLRQFNALDALVAQLTTTSNFLTVQLQNLPGISISEN